MGSRFELTRRVAVPAVCIITASVLGLGVRGRAQQAKPDARSAASGTTRGTTAAAPYLPNHRYDLPATLITAAQIESVKKKAVAENNVDVPMMMVKGGGAGGKHQVGISYNHKPKGWKAETFAIHDDVAEVYHVLEGDSIMLLGGKPKDPQRRPFSQGNGIGITGTETEGAQEIHISKGDMLIIPAGTPHKFKVVNEFLSYTVVRLDPDGVTPLSK